MTALKVAVIALLAIGFAAAGAPVSCVARHGKCVNRMQCATNVNDIANVPRLCAGAQVCCVPKPSAAGGNPGASNLPDSTPQTGVPRPIVSPGMRGIDVSTLIPKGSAVSGLSCLRQKGWKWLSVRAYQSSDKVDPNAAKTLKNAVAVGYTPEELSVYIFPCAKCGGAARQLKAMVAALDKAGVGKAFSTIWLDVENASLWPGRDASRTFYGQLLTACKALGRYTCGTYTSQVQWAAVMGSDSKGKLWEGGKNTLLWYPRYETPAQANTKDFRPFGAWTKPYGKQFGGTQRVCGVSVDVNILA